MLRTSLALLMSAGASMACDGGDTLLAQTSAAPEAVIALDPPPMAKPFAVEIRLCDAAAQAVRVDATMPAHKHGMNYVPTVSKLADGGFKAEGLVFHMRGQWEVAVEVDTGETTHRYTYPVMMK